MTKRIRNSAVLAIAVCGISAWHSRSMADEERVTERYAKLVEAAQAALERTQAAYETGHAGVEDVYRWPRRLMNAELKADPAHPSAIEDHAERMHKLNERVAALAKVGSAGGDPQSLYATEYYVAKAEMN